MVLTLIVVFQMTNPKILHPKYILKQTKNFRRNSPIPWTLRTATILWGALKNISKNNVKWILRVSKILSSNSAPKLIAMKCTLKFILQMILIFLTWAALIAIQKDSLQLGFLDKSRIHHLLFPVRLNRLLKRKTKTQKKKKIVVLLVIAQGCL